MFGDSVFDEEDRLRRAEEGIDQDDTLEEPQHDDVMGSGSLDERLRRRQAVAQLLREVGGC
ncbi:MAG TPA: hypothetical protein VHW65_07680 [Gemmatimonadales bacterium]|jgi:hypothetical protein|nr:hypothetical protein [Gemmatimonadales bacterium]